MTTTTDNTKDLEALANCARRADTCTKCEISETRRNSVFSDGNPSARVMVVGEGPGENEDEQGIPYVGPAGVLLTKQLASIGLNRSSDTYIANVIKCRAAEKKSAYNDKLTNRPPTPTEARNCSEYLLEQISIVKPEIILAFGNPALKQLSGDGSLGITKARGKFFYGPDGVPVIAMFHQAYLLRLNPEDMERDKRLTWEDLKLVRSFLAGDRSMLPPPSVKTTSTKKISSDTRVLSLI